MIEGGSEALPVSISTQAMAACSRAHQIACRATPWSRVVELAGGHIDEDDARIGARDVDRGLLPAEELPIILVCTDIV